MNPPPRFGRERKRRTPRVGFVIHLIVYVLVNAMLLGINLSTSPQHLWFLWPLFGWGIGLILHGVAVYVFSQRARTPH